MDQSSPLENMNLPRRFRFAVREISIEIGKLVAQRRVLLPIAPAANFQRRI